MYRGISVACILLIAAVVSLYGWGAHEDRADLTYVNPGGVHTLDPAGISWTQDFRLALNLWEGLTTWDPQTLQPIGGAARFPPDISPDGMRYTFRIRDDSRWSNGDAVTADDFIRGWRRGLEPGTAADYSFLLTDNIAGAANYVAWRREGAATLTALKRLSDGWPINATQARRLRSSDVWPQIVALAPPGVWHGAPNEVVRPDVLAKRLTEVDVDWEALHRDAFHRHADAMDDQFARVGISAVNERTLVVQLIAPCTYFADLLALPVFLPCHRSIEHLRERYRERPLTAEGLVVYDAQWTKPNYHRNGYSGLVTNGPYRVVDWAFKRRLRLGVNPYIRDADGIRCRSVDMMVLENINAALMAYEAGDVDFLPAMDVSYDHEIARLSSSGARPDFHLCNLLATYYFNFNCASGTVEGRTNPFTDRRVRKAFALAVDRKMIVDKVLQRGDRVAYTFVPPGGITGYDPPRGLRRDVDRARELLVEAGYGLAETFPPVELLYLSSDERVCQALARMWQDALGVRVELRSKESKTFAEDKANLRFMIARANWYADYSDPTTFLDTLATGNGNNDSGYSNPGYDALLARARGTRDPTARRAMLRRAEAIIVEEDVPILPILHYTYPIAIKPYVHGLHPNARLWFPFRHVTVDR